MQGNFSVNRKDLQSFTLVGPTREKPVSDPLAVRHFDAWLHLIEIMLGIRINEIHEIFQFYQVLAVVKVVSELFWV